MEINGFDKIFDTAVRALPIPSVAEEGIILAKNFFKEEENRNNVWSVFQNLFNKNGNVIKNIWDMKENIKEKGIKEGISDALDVLISNARNSNLISKKTANMLKDGKDVIVNKLINKKEDFEGQEKFLDKINEKYNKLEDAIQNNNMERVETLGRQIKNDAKNLLPTIELIRKIDNIDNTIDLYKSKIIEGKKEITNLEKEILSKIA